MPALDPIQLEGAEDPDLINAGKETVTELPGASIAPAPTRSPDSREATWTSSILGAMEGG